MTTTTLHDASLTNEDLEPTPESKRTWSRWHIAALWVGMAICIPTYTLASGLVDKGWSWQAAVGSVALGNLVVLVPMILNAHAGTRYGVPFPVLVRSSFGILGANIPAMLRAFVACGWFGINTYIGGAALAQMVRVLFLDGAVAARMPVLGIEPLELGCFLAFWALQVAIIWRGIDSIRVLETLSAPFLLLIGVLLLGWAWNRVGSFDALVASQPNAKPIEMSDFLGAGLTTAVSFWGTLALNIPDFSRFARSQKDQIIGQAIGLPGTMAFFAFIGAIVTNATAIIFGARISDPVALLGKIGGPIMTVLAMFALLIATLTTNLAANVVSPANDFSNLAPSKINFRTGAIITSVIGILIMPWKLYNDAASYLFTWLLGYGAMLGSVGGVMIADYFLIRKRTLDVDGLYKKTGPYTYTAGFNFIAIIALVAGILPNVPGFLAALGVIETSSFFKAIYDWAWFVAFGVSALVHVVGMKLLVRK
jgi:NCS1 family nucleobase:cation symporter-1